MKASEIPPRHQPLVSIIIATFNCSKVLPACLQSVSQQTNKNFEVIVIDGGSTDGTVDVIRANSAWLAHWRTEPDRGVYDAWNKALPYATGEWICFLGADDKFHDKTALDRIRPFLEGTPVKNRVIYGRLNIVDSNGLVREEIRRPWPNIRQGFLAGTTMAPHPGCFHHRSIFHDHGNYDPSFRIAGDYDLLLRELRNADATYVDEVTLVDMGNGGMSSSPENMVLGLREISRARTNNGLRFPSLGLLQRRLLAQVGVLILRIFGRRTFNFLADTYRRLGNREAKWS